MVGAGKAEERAGTRRPFRGGPVLGGMRPGRPSAGPAEVVRNGCGEDALRSPHRCGGVHWLFQNGRSRNPVETSVEHTGNWILRRNPSAHTVISPSCLIGSARSAGITGARKCSRLSLRLYDAGSGTRRHASSRQRNREADDGKRHHAGNTVYSISVWFSGSLLLYLMVYGLKLETRIPWRKSFATGVEWETCG